MGWDEVPVVAPTVTVNCPDNTILDPVGSSRTFSATISQASAVVVYFIPANTELSTVTISSWNVTAGQTITFTIDTSNVGGFLASSLAGTNTIRIVATNEAGSGSASCSWTLTADAPEVTMTCPDSTSAINPPTFYASVDQVATITVYYDYYPYDTQTGNNISFTPDFVAAAGTHMITVQAVNSNGVGSATCNWTVVKQDEVIQFTSTNPSYRTIQVMTDSNGNTEASCEFKGTVNKTPALVPQMTLTTNNYRFDTNESISSSGLISTTANLDDGNATGEYEGNVTHASITNITFNASYNGHTAEASWIWIVGDIIPGVKDSTIVLDPEGNLHIHIGPRDLDLLEAIMSLLESIGGIYNPYISTLAQAILTMIQGLQWLSDDASIDITIPASVVEAINNGQTGYYGGIIVNNRVCYFYL